MDSNNKEVLWNNEEIGNCLSYSVLVFPETNQVLGFSHSCTFLNTNLLNNYFKKLGYITFLMLRTKAGKPTPLIGTNFTALDLFFLWQATWHRLGKELAELGSCHLSNSDLFVLFVIIEYASMQYAHFGDHTDSHFLIVSQELFKIYRSLLTEKLEPFIDRLGKIGKMLMEAERYHNTKFKYNVKNKEKG